MKGLRSRFTVELWPDVAESCLTSRNVGQHREASGRNRGGCIILKHRCNAHRAWTLTHPSVARMHARASSLCANVMWALKFPGRGSDEFDVEMAICTVNKIKQRGKEARRDGGSKGRMRMRDSERSDLSFMTQRLEVVVMGEIRRDHDTVGSVVLVEIRRETNSSTTQVAPMLKPQIPRNKPSLGSLLASAQE